MLDKPQCKCGSEMAFLMDNKVSNIWTCPECGRLLEATKDGKASRWYRPEDRLRLQLECQRCGHTWEPRTEKLPKVCPNPKCKSPYWNRPRKS